MSSQQIEKGKQWLEQVLTLMGLETLVSTQTNPLYGAKADESWLVIEGESLSVDQKNLLLGNKGEGIESIQYLMNSLINLKVAPDEQEAFTIELDGYRLNRQAQLIELAQSLVEKVRSEGTEVEIEDLSSAERKQIHTLLEGNADIITESRGQEPDRRLVIRLR
ncbi:MAG: R3H domain-containing nucleic acid-binding protein [Cyanobacteriota bacterium ELA615]|jgi:spoIIIJ-associated protein